MNHNCNRSRGRVPLHLHPVDDRDGLRIAVPAGRGWRSFSREEDIAEIVPQRGEDSRLFLDDQIVICRSRFKRTAVPVLQD